MASVPKGLWWIFHVTMGNTGGDSVLRYVGGLSICMQTLEVEEASVTNCADNLPKGKHQRAYGLIRIIKIQ